MIRVKETASYLIITGSNTDLKALDKEFMFHPPNYWMSPRFKLYQQTDGKTGWDGYLHPFKIKTMTNAIIERGHLQELSEKCELLGIEMDAKETLPHPMTGLTVDDIPDDLVESDQPPYHHQLESVLAFIQANIGICEITVSGGKTRTFCMAAAMVKVKWNHARILYLVPTERLVNQAYKDAKAFLPQWSITQYGGGKKENHGADMVVATNAMIGSNMEELVKDGWLKTFMVLMIDECHHASSPTLENIILKTPAFFKFGASDSAKQGDKKEDEARGFKIRGLLGPLLMKTEAGELIESGKLARPTIYIVDRPEWNGKHEELAHQAEPNTKAWAYMNDEWVKATYLGPALERDSNGDVILDKKNRPTQILGKHRLELQTGVELDFDSKWCLLDRAYDTAIIRFKERNQDVCDWAEYFAKNNEHTLVVCTRTLHVLILEEKIGAVVGENNVRSLFSAHTSKERDAAFTWIREAPGRILISPLVKEGVSLNELTAGIVADYIGTVDVARQIIGRFIRKKSGRENSARVVWFNDRQVPSYRRGCKELFTDLRKIVGYEFKTVTDPKSILYPESLELFDK